MIGTNGFNKWAGNYDESINSDLDQFPFAGYYDVLSAVKSHIVPIIDSRILDVGIGTALLSHELFIKGSIIYGIDFSNQMIEQAKIKIPSGNFEVVNVANNHFGKFNSFKFDYIISSYFFHHLTLPEKINFFKQSIKNNLTENGKIIIADVGYETKREFENAYIQNMKFWDTSEYYLCGEKIVNCLKKEGIKTVYTQISPCAGILVFENK